MKVLGGLFVYCFLLAVSLHLSVSQSLAISNQELVKGAKKEGHLVYWTTMTLSQSREVVDEFEKKYPYIKVDLFRTGGGPMLNKILTEARANRFAWDLVSGRGELFLPLMKRKLLAPYRSPEAKKIPSDMKDNQGYWTGYYVNPYALGYNTELVKKADAPKTYQDLLHPRWKGGKISIDTEAFGLFHGLMVTWGKEKTVSYFKKLAAQEPVPMRGNTHRVQLVMAGEFPLIIAYAPTIQRATSMGAPIDWVPLEPVVIQVNPVMLSAKAPNPNAAKLFMDFILPGEGQRRLVGFKRIPVREDILPDPERLIKGYKRVVENPEEFEDFNEVVKLYQEIFKLR
jgi:iron(III) transport system substrate-binding protein